MTNAQGRHVLRRGLAVLAGAFGFLVQGAPQAQEANPRLVVPYALTISGGISLGAYEAGANWGFLKFLRGADNKTRSGDEITPKLVAVTGASAGAINALVSAVSWCIDPGKVASHGELAKSIPETSDRVSDNLFYATWVGVGDDALLPPRERKAAYRDDDGLLARSAFVGVLLTIGRVIGLTDDEAKRYRIPVPSGKLEAGGPVPDIFRSPCDVRLGFTVTSEKPHRQVVAGLEVDNPRHFIPLMLSVRKGRIEFRHDKIDHRAPGFGNVIYLPHVEGRIESGAVVNAVLTSSAFPVAFGRRVIEYCRPDVAGSAAGSKDGNGSDGCGPMRRESAVFIDGGVFDNVPLGATKALAETDRDAIPRRVSYVYVDPDNRRGNMAAARKTDQDDSRVGNVQRFDLASQMGFLPGSIESARGYELHKELGTGDWNAKVSDKVADLLSLLPSSAKDPVATSDRPFRCGAPDPSGECAAFLRNPGDASGDRFGRLAEQCLDELRKHYEYGLQRCRLETQDARTGPRREALDAIGRVAKALGERPGRRDDVRAIRNGIERAEVDPLGDRVLFLSSRFHAITGQHLGGFGAFLHPRFREFDYYVGVYDAAHTIAEKVCDIRRSYRGGRGQDIESCVRNELDKARRVLSIDDDPRARHVFSMLSAREAKGVGVEAKAAADSSESSKAIAAYDRIAQSLMCPAAAAGDPDVECRNFEAFIDRLKVNDSNCGQASSGCQFTELTTGQKTWQWKRIGAAAARMAALEGGSDKGNASVRDGFAFVADFADRRVADDSAWWLRNESDREKRYPRDTPWLSALKPYELGVRTGREPVPFVGWRARLTFGLLDLPIQVQFKAYCGRKACSDDQPWMTQLGAAIDGSWKGIHFGLGVPEWNRRWEARQGQQRNGWGMSGFVESGCLRFTAGKRSLGGQLVPEPTDYYAELGYVIYSGRCF